MAFIEQYKTLTKEFPSLQDDAMKHFNRLGFPTIKNEEWKYTNINPIFKKDFSFLFPESKISREEILQKFPFAADGILVVVENGKLNIGLSDLKNNPGEIEIKKVSEIKNNPLVKKHYNLYVDVQEDAFGALNTAFANDGLVIFIHSKAVIEKPVYIINISYSQEQAVISHNRLLVIAEKNSSAKIAWVTISKNNLSETFLNAQNEIFVDENASLEFDVLQNENEKSFQICGTHVYQAANSKFSISTISLGGSILRNKLHIKLDGQNCETHLYGLYVAGNSQLMDNHTAVYHTMPNSNSNQLYKGIINGKAQGVFNGKVFVERDAQKTNAYQSNKNILLSDDASVFTKPQLEIYADDVKCSHGATTGQLDEEALFYLRARGIGENDAKALLNFAFASDIIQNIKIDSLKEYLQKLLAAKLDSNIEFDLN